MTFPVVRILADGSPQSAGPKMGRDYYGYLAFIQDPEETSLLTVDWTGYLGSETISTAVWTAERLTLANDTITGKTTTVKVSAVPERNHGDAKVELTTSSGRVIVRRFRYYGSEM